MQRASKGTRAPQGQFAGIRCIAVGSRYTQSLKRSSTQAISVLYVFIARGLWQLRPWARIVATVLSAIGLIGFPLGTIISAYFLYLLQSKKAAMVFSEDYKRVIAATPHVKYKTSLIAWVLLGLLVALVIVVVIAAIGSR